MIPAFNLEKKYEAKASVPLSVDHVWVLIKKSGSTKDDDPFISILIYDDLSWYYKEYLKGSKRARVGFKTKDEEEVILAFMKWLSKRSGIKI